MREKVLRAAEAQYLALEAYGIVRADFFWEGFEEFQDFVVALFE